MCSIIKSKYDESRRDEERVAIIGTAEEGIRINRTNNYASNTILLWIFLSFMSLIIYGAKHLKDCPAENMVAISLIVIGSLGLLIKIVNCPYECQEAFGVQEVPKKKTIICISALLAVIFICMIISCAIRSDDCSTENTITISFIVIGTLGFMMKTVSCPYEWREDFDEHGVSRNKVLIWISALLNFILLGWFLAMCYWSFKMDPDTKAKDHDKPNYCALEFYLISFWGSIVGLTVLGVRFMFTCCTEVFCSVTSEA